MWKPSPSLVYESALTAKHLNAYADVEGGVFEYNPPLGTVPSPMPSTVVAGGAGRGRGGGENVKEEEEEEEGTELILRLTYRPEDPSSFNCVEAERRIKLERRRPAIVWMPTSYAARDALSLTLTYGEPLTEALLSAQLCPRQNSALALSALQGGSLHYSHAVGDLLPVGDWQLCATFAPPAAAAPRYSSSQARLALRVLQAAPQLRWKLRPAFLYEGEALCAKQLCAEVTRAEVFRGELHYSPSLGAVLPLGRHKLRVEFVPAEPRNVKTATLTVPLEVCRRPPKLVVEVDPRTGTQRVKKMR